MPSPTLERNVPGNPKDPQVRYLRSRIAIHSRLGRTVEAAEARDRLNAFLAIRSLRFAAPTMTDAERVEVIRLATAIAAVGGQA